MNRREFAMAGIGTLIASEAVGFAAEGQHAGHDDHCAEACSDCARACESCSTHCAKLAADGKKDHLASLMTCRDCADFCSTAAQVVARRGPFMELICTACAEACARCAKECEKFPDDAHMAACAKSCRKCEKACREMLKTS